VFADTDTDTDTDVYINIFKLSFDVTVSIGGRHQNCQLDNKLSVFFKTLMTDKVTCTYFGIGSKGI
jgi:hypothetical protein